MRACSIRQDFRRGGGRIGAVVGGIVRYPPLPLLHDVLVIRQRQIQPQRMPLLLPHAREPCQRARQNAVAQQAAEQQPRPLCGVCGIACVAGGGNGGFGGHGEAEFFGQPRQCGSEFGKGGFREQRAFPVEAVLAHAEQQGTGGGQTEKGA